MSEQELALRLPDGTLGALTLDRPLILGTDPGEGGLRVDGPGVVSRHLAIAKLKSGGFGLKVIDASAVTLIDDRPVRQARLALGSRLTLGEVTLEVVDAAARPAPQTSPSTPKPHDGPSVVGGFRVERLIGRGSMGRVFLSVQESLDRQVALKLLRPELANDSAFVQRFQAEARAAAALSHNNVVTVYDVGEADGHHYLALEYMDRGSLEDRLAADGPLPWRAVLAVLRDAASGLEYAEQKGLVHRDIKPANLMQTSAGATKLVDLGLATSMEATSDGDGVIRGTPHFMSPEQARGAPLDIRSDLFSLGSTAYRLLTGKTPFEGDTSKAILRAVVQEEPRPAESIVSDVPRPLGGLLSALMAKDPNDRPASATAARVRIEELITELGGASPSSGGSSSSSRRTLAIVAVLLVVAVAATLPFILGGDDPQGSGLDLAEGSTPTTGGPERVKEAPDPEQDPEARPATDSGEALAFDDTILEAAERDAEAAIEQARMLSDPTERMAALRAVAEQYLGTDAATRAASEALALESGEENADSSAEVAETEVATDAELLDALRATALDSDGEHLAPQAAFHAVSKVTPPIGYPDFPHFEELRLEVYGELEVTLRAIADSRLDTADGELEAGRLDAAQAGWSELLAWLEFLPPELAERLEETTDADGNLIEDAGAVTELPTDREGLLALIEQDQALDSAYVWRLTDRIELVSDRLEQLERAWRERFVIAMEQLDQARIADTLPGGDFERALARFDLEGAARAVEQLAQELRSDRYRAGLGSLVDRLRGARSAFVWLADEWRADGWRRSTVPLPGAGRETGDARQLTAAGIVVETDEGNRDIAWSEFALDSAAIEGLFSNRMKRDYTSTERVQVADLIGFAAVNETFDRVDAVFDPSQRGRLSPQESNKLAASFERARAFAGEAASDALLDEVEAVRWLSTGLMAVDDRDWGTASYSFEVLLEDTATATATLLLSEGTPQGATVTWPPILTDPEPWTPPTNDGDVGETNDVEEEL